MIEKLTLKQAFRTVIKFLDGYYKNNPSDDLGLLLGEMQLQNDNISADSATWGYWIDSANRVIDQENHLEIDMPNPTSDELNVLDTFKAMINFLKIYHNQIQSDDIQAILDDLRLSDNNEIIDWAVKRNWRESVDYIVSDKDPMYGYFQIFR